MLKLADGGNKKPGELGVGDVLVFLNLHGCRISKKLQTDEKLKRWLTSQNRNFNETNEPIVSADMTKTATYDKVAIF